MAVKLMVAKGSGPTGQIIKQLLQERGIDVTDGTRNFDAVISYGCRYEGTLPSLNGLAGGRTKLTELTKLDASGIQVPPVFTWNGNRLVSAKNLVPTFPMFGRKLAHKEGKDIMPAYQIEDVPWRVAAGAAYFTQYIPRESEFRIYVFRKMHLATYEKVMTRPQQYRFNGCSYRNGFTFQLVNAANLDARGLRPAIELAGNAVNAMGLDFAAVDMLQGKDGRFYVLELNTAPGADEGRQSLTSLADKMANWVKKGYLRRNGDPANANKKAVRSRI